MSAIATSWARLVAKENTILLPADRRALMCLAKAHTYKHGTADRSYQSIANETMDCLRTVKASVARLVSFGLIEKHHQRKGQRQGVNRYFLNMNVLRVQICTPKTPLSGCNKQTPEVVQPLHPEKSPQSANLHHPTRACARAKTETSGFTISIIDGGRKHA